MTAANRISSARRNRGFTLAEIAIVTLILGLMVVGVLGALTTQINQGRVSVTQRQLEEIRESLLGFAAQNGYLPCPDTTGDGIEDTNRANPFVPTCPAVEGFLPWVTLGVPQTDAWGMRFRYRIKDEFARPRAADSPLVHLPVTGSIAGCKVNPSPLTASDPALTDPPSSTDPNNCTLDIQDTGNIEIKTRGNALSAKTEVTLAGGTATSGSGLPVVIMSFGKNSAGGVDSLGNIRPAPPVSNFDEYANWNTAGRSATAPLFYSRISKEADAPCDDTAGPRPMCEFDDIVTWISAPLLISKMIQANRLP